MKNCLILSLACISCFSAFASPELYSGADFRDTIATAKQKVQPAVLYVSCITESTERGKLASQTVSGSAFTISADGEFVTNWHVVDKAKSIRCLLSDGRNFEATCIGSDKSMDIALCKLKLKPGESVPYAEFGKSSLLDEGTAAAEAMTLAKRSCKSKSNVFFVSNGVHPQTLEVVHTRAEPLGIERL